jgi:hypothetical protein
MTLPLVALAALGLLVTGCGDTGGPGEVPGETGSAGSWTLEQVGGADFTATSTSIKITFKKALDLTEKGENLNNLIDVIGAAERDGVLRKQGDGKSWLIPIAVTGAGAATVIINENSREIEVASKPVVIFKKFEFAPVTWTVTCNGDEENSTNQLVFTFTGDIIGQFYLTSGMIKIAPDPDVEMRQRGNASVTSAIKAPGDDYVFEIGVNTSTTGWVLITIDMDGVDTFPRRLRLILGSNDMFKPPEGSGESAEEAENGGTNMPFTWTVLTVTNDDPDEMYGNGRIVGADLQKIRAAWNRDTHFFDSEMSTDSTVKGGYGSFLRIYADVSSVIPEETKWSKISVGNQENTGRNIEGQEHNFAFKSLQGIPVGPGIVTVDGSLRHIIPDFLPDTDNYLSVQSWDGVIVHAVVLYEIVTPVKLVRPPRWKRDIAIMCAAGRIGGDGSFFHYYDQLATDEAPAGAWIEFYVKGSGAGNWGSTGWNWTVGRPGCINLSNGNLQNDPEWGRYNRITMATINEERPKAVEDRNRINPYAGSAFDKVWLCWNE